MAYQPWIDPEIEAFLAAMPAIDLTLSHERLETVRSMMNASLDLVPLSDAVERRDVMVPGAPGDPDVPLRIHRPKGVKSGAPCFFSIHGGGYVLGSHRMDDARLDRWCQALGCIGVSVDYRLAPETPYPGPLEDCYAGVKWVFHNADELGIDPTRTGIGGASAGGGLAAALALLIRQRKEFAIAFQLLIYPMIDDRGVTTTSSWDTLVWTSQANNFAWRAYLGDLYGTETIPETAAPARAKTLSGLPPAFVMVGAADGFCDEDIHYAQRLNHDGVPTEFHLYPGAPHGFDGMMPTTSVAQMAQRDALSWVGRQMKVTLS